MAGRAEPKPTPSPASVGWRQRITAPPHHSATTSAEVLQPQSVVYWSALPAGGPGGGYRGRSTVNSDGDIKIGPYGVVHVAGMTPEQAKAAVTRQIAQNVPNPRV